MDEQVHISRLHALPADLEALRREAVAQGFRFMDRLCADWVSGANTFSRPGESLLGVLADGKLIGVGGLNVDPYQHRGDVGRIRHVYVLVNWRRQGVGQRLVRQLLDEARVSFREVRLRTDTEEAALFYAKCGFATVDDTAASHALQLG